MVRLAGLEPATYGLEVRCSIQLSYRRKQDGLISKRSYCVQKKIEGGSFFFNRSLRGFSIV